MIGTFAKLQRAFFAYKFVLLSAGTIGLLLLAFQNCSPQSFKASQDLLSSDASSTAGTSFCDSNPTLPECANPSSAQCSFNGVVLNNGETIVAYRNSSVAAGKTCRSETRKCNNGTLSGSFRYANCTVNAPSACSFDGKSVAHGDVVKAYLKSSVPFAETCTEEERACDNGSLSGSFQYSSCKVGEPVSCLFDGKTILHGESVTAYPASSVAFGETCTPATRTCYNGALTNSGDFASCTVNAPASCLFDSKTIAHEEKVTAYEKSAVAYGETCVPLERTCSNGTLSGTGDYGSCVVDQPDSCLVNGITVPHDGNITLYFANHATASESCKTEVRSCINGLLSGSAAFSSCEPLAPEPCTFDGKSVASGSSVTAYAVSSVAFGTTCPEASTRTCTNGVLSGSGDFPSCSVEKAANCTFNGKAVAHESSVSAYEKNSVPFGSTCQVSTRTCTNGSLSGSGDFESCKVATAVPCDFNGRSITHGKTVTAYSSANVPFGSSCTATTRTCSNGVLSGSGDFSSCKVAAAAPCDFSGTSIAHSKSVKAYSVSSVPFGSSCPAAVTRTCSNGVLSGSGDFTSCSVTAASSCSFNGTTIAHNGSVQTYASTSVPYGESCKATTRKCSNGVLSGTGDVTTCTVQAAANCTLDGQTIANGSYRYAYAKQSVPYGQACSYSLRRCTNGVLTGTGDYLSCTTEPGASCEYKGTIIADGKSISAYSTELVTPDQSCSSIKISCTNGKISSPFYSSANMSGPYFYCSNSEIRTSVKPTYSADGYLWTEIKLPVSAMQLRAISEDGTRVIATLRGWYGTSILTSIDGGLNWKFISQAQASYEESFVQLSRDGKTIVTNGYLGESRQVHPKDQLLISKDFGKTWDAPKAFENKTVLDVAVSKDGTFILAAISDGILMTSKDAGQSWTSNKMFTDSTLPPPTTPDVTPLPQPAKPKFVRSASLAISPDGQHIFIAAEVPKATYSMSHDGGATWITGTPLSEYNVYQSPIKATISDDGKVITLGNTYSANSGYNWAFTNALSFVEPGTSNAQYAITHLHTTADGQTLTYAGPWFLTTSNNKGASWKELNKQYNLGAKYWSNVVGSASGNHIIAQGADDYYAVGSVLFKAVKSTEVRPYAPTGENFKRSDSAVRNTYSIALSRDGSWIYTGSAETAWSEFPTGYYYGGSCFYSPNRDVSWGSLWLRAPWQSSNYRYAPGIYCDFKVSSDGKTALTKTDGGVYITRNNSASWEFKRLSNLQGGDLIGEIFSDVFMSADGNKIFLSGQRNYVSSDSGKSWKEVPTWPNSMDVNKLASDNLTGLTGSADGSILYAYLDSMYGYKGLMKSVDGGTTWKQLIVPFPIKAPKYQRSLTCPSSIINGDGCGNFKPGNIDVSMDGNQVTVVDDDGRIQLSLDGGKTWSTRDLPEYIMAIKVSASENGQIIAAITEFGYLYISKDRGASWVEQTRAGRQPWASVKVSADGTFVAVGSRQEMATANKFNSLMTATITPPLNTVPLYLEPNAGR